MPTYGWTTLPSGMGAGPAHGWEESSSASAVTAAAATPFLGEPLTSFRSKLLRFLDLQAETGCYYWCRFKEDIHLKIKTFHYIAYTKVVKKITSETSWEEAMAACGHTRYNQIIREGVRESN